MLPAVLSVTLKLFVPLTSAALAGKAAFVSVDVMATVSFVLITFQLASTAFTETLKAAPAVCAEGVPVFPLVVPGAAVSPGTSNCIFANAPAFTWMAGLVLAVFVPSVASVAVKVQPLVVAVRKVTLKDTVPETIAVLAGRLGLGAEEVRPTVSPTVLTTFQFASTALTVTLNAVPAVCAAVVPVLPVAVPGAAVSPGANNCNFTNEPPLIVMEELVLAVLVPSVMSLAVTVRLPALLHVMLKVCVPPTSAALTGSTALASLEVIPTRSLAVEMKFQLASTALTVTLNAVPAV